MGGAISAPATRITAATFQINNAKLYAPVVTLSVNGNTKFLEHLKQQFRRTVSWSKYRSEIKTESKNNNLNCIVDPTFRNINRLFFFLSKMVTMIVREIILVSVICN